MTRTEPQLTPPFQTSAPHQRPSIPVFSKPYGRVVGHGLWVPHQREDVWTSTTTKRLRNIADNADRKAHNLYLNHTQTQTKSSQVRLGLLSTAVAGDRFGVSDRDVAAIASSVLHDVGLITSKNSDLVVDENKLRREKAKVRKDLKFQALSEAQALPLKGLYFNGRKDSREKQKRNVYVLLKN
ncbi:hypothetical protein AVEN_165886-1 [Araneus ventricosus]|uniref:Uncharacterized protein n=1 Tax=Araneus ventricosus TaxID=182803 RepID=A0A4Y2J9H4_ARAVE|nr:hypothetical protein AVEN_165886-1 [Araneus ventricosus]